eukprot:TRINITY_DN2003_c0_g1_i6.p1 TRINITY_DN2003_c0_g1~~TRINITY_DN2003_c0_g1_i6.p1  ORF type:complete len:205 (-),score=40.51 TRINITY_DN2003_c0_g1_i6:430-1044(-)
MMSGKEIYANATLPGVAPLPPSEPVTEANANRLVWELLPPMPVEIEQALIPTPFDTDDSSSSDSSMDHQLIQLPESSPFAWPEGDLGHASTVTPVATPVMLPYMLNNAVVPVPTKIFECTLGNTTKWVHVPTAGPRAPRLTYDAVEAAIRNKFSLGLDHRITIQVPQDREKNRPAVQVVDDDDVDVVLRQGFDRLEICHTAPHN